MTKKIHSHKHDHLSDGHTHDIGSPSLKDYLPLIVVVFMILLSTAAFAKAYDNTFMSWMMGSMGFFFIFFSLFKLVDLSGFKEGFSHYDLIAKRLPAWGYLYPFIELLFGAAFLFMVDSSLLLVSVFIISLINVMSVAIKLAKKERFICACLGTALKVPLTTVTLLEYSMMAGMALWMLVF